MLRQLLLGAIGVVVIACPAAAHITLETREAPVGVQDLRVTAVLDTDADDDTLAKLAQLTERYCVVAHSLAGPVHFTVIRAA